MRCILSNCIFIIFIRGDGERENCISSCSLIKEGDGKDRKKEREGESERTLTQAKGNTYMCVGA